jgi:hypothetical protein
MGMRDEVEVGLVGAFSDLYSPQGRQPLSFLGTMFRAEEQELSEQRAVPSRNIASTRLWRKRVGLLPVSMVGR